MAKVGVSVGSQRISDGTRESVAAATRTTRKQFAQVQRNLQELLNTLRNATPEAMVHALQPIYRESQSLVPVDSGDLKGSGFLQVTERGKEPKVALGYGRGGKPFYTAFVHENLEAKHKAPTQAKFLQQPLDDQFHLIQPRIVEYLRKQTEK